MLVIMGRVPLFSKEIRRFVKFINKESPLDDEIRLVVLPHAEILEDRAPVAPDEEDDPTPYYGIYHPALHSIWVALGMFYPEHLDMALLIIAHEYYHAQQEFMEVKWDERQADAWAVKSVIQYIRHKRGNR